jgi:hypothetical protein
MNEPVKYPITRIDADNVEYRGAHIRRRTQTPTGYFGRYVAHAAGNRYHFSTLREAKAWVDSVMDAKEAKPGLDL